MSNETQSAIGESSRPDDVLERCASILEHRASEWDSAVREGSEQRGYEEAVLMECAGAIRSLKGTYAPSHVAPTGAEGVCPYCYHREAPPSSTAASDLDELEECFSALGAALNCPLPSFSREYIETRRTRMHNLIQRLRRTQSAIAFSQGDAHPCDISKAIREQTIIECAKFCGSFLRPNGAHTQEYATACADLQDALLAATESGGAK